MLGQCCTHVPVAKVAPEERWPTSAPDNVTLGFEVAATVADNWSGGEMVRAALLTMLL